MIVIITGTINSGKSTRLTSLYGEAKCGDGFVVEKVFGSGSHVGQAVRRLSTGECRPLSIRSGRLPPDWDEVCRFGPYSFSGRGFAFANGIIADALGTGAAPIFMDEIGPLELEGKGFAHSLSSALESGRSMYLVVRESSLGAVTRRFGMRRFEVLRI